MPALPIHCIRVSTPSPPSTRFVVSSSVAYRPATLLSTPWRCLHVKPHRAPGRAPTRALHCFSTSQYLTRAAIVSLNSACSLGFPAHPYTHAPHNLPRVLYSRLIFSLIFSSHFSFPFLGLHPLVFLHIAASTQPSTIYSGNRNVMKSFFIKSDA